jgi:uncharacterized damage-inducible protein DinB
MKITTVAIENVLQLLSETPQRIAAATGALNDDQLHLQADKKSWSANDILAHLHACADVWGETIAAMLQDDEPALNHVSPRTYLKKTDYLERPFHDLFMSFVDQRRKLLLALHDLEFSDWSRGAMIKDRRHTIFSQARRLALHEVTHNEQLEILCRDLLTG